MDQQSEIAQRLQQANNILVTVSNNPSVDQLAACIGLTLALNKMGKHATAVFSGAVPSTIEFLQPEKTLEKNTDSLRDFIIALDKSKADKLRYKVEDKIVKIFITPYKTSISEHDLNFSQGDFNVDVVLALGVHSQADLDQAITAHGRILHDAAVVTINLKAGGELGSINWVEPTGSSLSELIVELLDSMNSALIDGQMATAFLTGIVAETNRFSNEKTSPTTMSISAELMGKGANQQLVATKLEPPTPPPIAAPAPVAQPIPSSAAPSAIPLPPAPAAAPKPDDGTLEISHNDFDESKEPNVALANQPLDETPQKMSQINIDEHGALRTLEEQAETPDGTIDPNEHLQTQHMILQPPSLGGQLTANTTSEDAEASSDPLSLPSPDNPDSEDIPAGQQSPLSPSFGAPGEPKIMTHDAPPAAMAAPPLAAPLADPMSLPPVALPEPAPPPVSPPLAAAPAAVAPMLPPADQQTLSEIEAEVHSPHVDAAAPTPAADPLVGLTDNPAAPSLAPPADPVQPAIIPEPPAPDDASLANARDAVMQAIAAHPSDTPAPIQALNAQPLGQPLHDAAPAGAPSAPSAALSANEPSFASVTQPQDPTAAPPVPPPMVPPQNW